MQQSLKECRSFSLKAEIGRRVHMEELQSIKVVAGSWSEKVQGLLPETERKRIKSISILSQQVRLSTLVGCQYFAIAALFNLLRKQFILQLHPQAWRILLFRFLWPATISFYKRWSHWMLLFQWSHSSITGIYEQTAPRYYSYPIFQIRGLSISFSGSDLSVSIFSCSFWLSYKQLKTRVCLYCS